MDVFTFLQTANVFTQSTFFYDLEGTRYLRNSLVRFFIYLFIDLFVDNYLFTYLCICLVIYSFIYYYLLFYYYYYYFVFIAITTFMVITTIITNIIQFFTFILLSLFCPDSFLKSLFVCYY